MIQWMQSRKFIHVKCYIIRNVSQEYSKYTNLHLKEYFTFVRIAYCYVTETILSFPKGIVLLNLSNTLRFNYPEGLNPYSATLCIFINGIAF